MIQEVGVFHNIAHVGSAWGCSDGIVVALRRLGYTVHNLGNPRKTPTPIDVLQRLDAIVMGGPEWYFKDIEQQYGIAWASLCATKVAWYTETAQRDDKSFDFAGFKKLADVHFYPAKQDAHEFNGHWLPFGADEQVFRPLPVPKQSKVGFIGTTYAKRDAFIRSLRFPVTIMPKADGATALESVQQLANAYNSTSIFLNLPAYSRLLVTKVTEVLLCRTMLMTPKLDHPSALKNMEQFRDGHDLIYYDPNNVQDLRDKLTFYSQNEMERERIAEQGYFHALAKHTLLTRVRDMMATVSTLTARG